VSSFRLDASSCAASGWVDQTSPACAAAAVAGAVNAVMPIYNTEGKKVPKVCAPTHTDSDTT
jgi:hypothetical protein